MSHSTEQRFVSSCAWPPTRGFPRSYFWLPEGCTAKEVGCRLNMSENAVNKALGKFRADVAGIQKGAC